GLPKTGSKKKLLILVVLLVLAGLGTGAYMLFRPQNKPTEDTSQQSQTESTPEAEEISSADCADGFTEFAGDNMGLYFCYPESWGNTSLVDGQEMDHSEQG